MVEKTTVRIEADASPFNNTLKELEKNADRFAAQLTSGLKSAVVSGKELDDVLRQLALNLASIALDAGLKPLQGLLSEAISGLFGGFFAKGGVPGSITPFANGGVVSQPTFFNAGGSLGLMGEAGSEAILPLKRGSDGKLGVAAAGGASPVNITFNVQATDAASFRKSEAQITGMLARAVARGARTI